MAVRWCEPCDGAKGASEVRRCEGSPRASGTIALRTFGRTAARSRFAAGLRNYRTSHVRTHRRTFAVRRGPRELSHFARSDAPPHVRGSPRASGTIALRTFGRTAAPSHGSHHRTTV